MSRPELARIVETYAVSGGRLMVGFNRRFAEPTDRVREMVAKRREPLLIHYRVNAGFLAADHWLQDPVFGGGRVIGEACHFIDWMRSVVGTPIQSVTAVSTANAGIYRDDNLSAQLTFQDGSVGNLIYCANGNAGLSKEAVEIFCQGSAAVLDDYRQVTTYIGDRQRVHKISAQDKGHKAEMHCLIDAVQKGTDLPIPFDEQIEVTSATFAILESIAEGVRIELGGPSGSEE
jgi:predicted dehydrogenase